MKLALPYCLVALAAAACGDNLKSSSTPDASMPDVPVGTTVLRSTLTGFQEVPPVYATARGSAVLGINAARTEISIDVSYANLTGITAAHIHAGKPGVNGAPIFTLATESFASPLRKTLTSTDFSAGGGVETFEDAVQAIIDGETYVNIHTAANPGGALRGHVGTATIQAVGSSSQAVEPIDSPASITTTLMLNDAQDTISLTLDAEMLSATTGAQIRVGEVGGTGPAMFVLATGAVADPLSVTLSSTELVTNTGAGINSMADAVDAILSGRAYVSVDATSPSPLSIRGQLGAVTLRSTMTPGQERLSVASAAEGRSYVTISADQTTLTTSTTFTDLMSPTMSHIHAGGFRVDGPPIFTLANAPFTSPLDKTLTATDFTAGGGLTTFPAAINAMLSGNTYVNLHTTANSAGEVRGQLGRVSLRASMNGPNERPTPVVTTATGTADVTITGSQRAIVVTVAYDMLTGITGAHIHAGNSNTAGPVLFGLAAATFASPSTFTVGPMQLTPQPALGITDMADAIGAMLDGGTYVNVHTMLHPDGEIRGQVVAP